MMDTEDTCELSSKQELLITPLKYAIHRTVDHPLFGKGTIHIELHDTSEGPCIKVTAPAKDCDPRENSIMLDFKEVEAVHNAAKKLVQVYPEYAGSLNALLKNILEELRISPENLSERLGIPVETFHSILNDELPFTSELAGKLDEYGLIAIDGFWSEKAQQYREYREHFDSLN